MSYERELTTFEKGNQLSNCGKYNLQDLEDMFSETEIGGAEDEDDNETYLEDILIESKSFKGNFDLNMSVTIMEQLDDDEMNMFIIKSEHEDTNNLPCDKIDSAELDNFRDDKVECSLELDYEWANESI